MAKQGLMTRFWRSAGLALLTAFGVIFAASALLPSSRTKPLPTVAVLPTNAEAAMVTTLAILPTDLPTNTATFTPMPTITATATITQTATATLVPTNTALPTITPTTVFNEEEYTVALLDGFFIAAGGRRVMTVTVTDGRQAGGEIAAIVTYVTTETTTQGYQDEIVDLFEAAGSAIEYKDLAIDSVMLIGGENELTASLIVTATTADILAYSRREISRAEFFERMNSESLTIPTETHVVWDCGGDIYNCGDFIKDAELLDYWKTCVGDPSRLDRDNDGKPCEL